LPGAWDGPIAGSLRPLARTTDRPRPARPQPGGPSVNGAPHRPPVNGTRHRPLLIGLTGPIGCGKSTVARMLAGLGGTVIDADALAREVTLPGAPTLPQIRRRFGDDVFNPDGSLDRAALAAVVFNDAEGLRDLEAITHPEVRRLVEAQLRDPAGAGAPFVAIEAIKLVEGGLAERCDEVWLIDCPPDVQRERLRGRGMDGADADRRIAAQGDDLIERIKALLPRNVISRVLPTQGTLDDVRGAVERALAEAISAH
jgi:dephospho-CoA kinase